MFNATIYVYQEVVWEYFMFYDCNIVNLRVFNHYAHCLQGNNRVAQRANFREPLNYDFKDKVLKKKPPRMQPLKIATIKNPAHTKMPKKII